jgi:hypothetical protein
VGTAKIAVVTAVNHEDQLTMQQEMMKLSERQQILFLGKQNCAYRAVDFILNNSECNIV